MAFVFALAALLAMQNGASQAAGALAAVPSDRAAVAHALNPLTFAPTPGQVDEVQRLGLARWIDQQLNPASIDDSAVQSRLTPLPDPPEVDRRAARNLSEQERMEMQRRSRQATRQSVQALAAQKLT